MEKTEAEEAMEVNTSPVVVREAAVGTMTTVGRMTIIGEVREVVIAVVANINNVEEAEAIAITTNLKVL